jgi:hypothetical protein
MSVSNSAIAVFNFLSQNNLRSIFRASKLRQETVHSGSPYCIAIIIVILDFVSNIARRHDRSISIPSKHVFWSTYTDEKGYRGIFERDKGSISDNT